MRHLGMKAENLMDGKAVDSGDRRESGRKYKIAVAGTGYVGMSIATLLSQYNEVYAVDIVPERVEAINSRKSPIRDEHIEKYLAEKDLNLTATLDAEGAYSRADFVVIAVFDVGY